MTNRAAIDTLRGYYYQFDYSVYEILTQNDINSKVRLEGIEDVDIVSATETTAIQCKYYEKTEYNHSVIAKPIRLMLQHFKKLKDEKKPLIRYKLRGHYKSGHTKLSLPIDVDFLKKHFLTYTTMGKKTGKKTKHLEHLKLGLNDNDLSEFLKLLDINILAEEFEQQYKSVISSLKKLFDCQDFEAENFYYNNALRHIRELTKTAIVKKREISKGDFIKNIEGTKDILFDAWYIQKKGEKVHFDSLKKKYFSELNILLKERFFLIEIKQDTYSRNDVKDIISILIKKYCKIINQPHPFCSYLYLHGIENSELIELKKDLVDGEVVISDGFDFEGATFSPKSLSKRPSPQNYISIKFINDISYLKSVMQLTGKKTEIFQFYYDTPYFITTDPSHKDVSIQIKSFNHINQIIK